MNKALKIGIVAALAVVVAVVVAMKRQPPPPGEPAAASAPAKGLPKLLELGSTTCTPCKTMAPIIDELKREYQGRLEVEFINVSERPEAVRQYQINMIPAQIFLDPNGQTKDMHYGIWSKDDILNNWKRLGYDLTGRSGTAATSPSQPAAAP